MRILVLSNLYPPNVVGGYERLCFEVTAGLAAMGHEMVVLTSRYGGKVADYPGQVVKTRRLRSATLTGPAWISLRHISTRGRYIRWRISAL